MSGSIPIRAVCVSCIVVRRAAEGPEYLLLRRAAEESLPGIWSYVAGRVEEGETGVQAIRRELLEETGLVPEALYSSDFVEQFYAADGNHIELVAAFVAFVGADAEVTLDEEHQDFAWLPLSDAVGRVAFPPQKELLGYVDRWFVREEPCALLRIAGPAEGGDENGERAVDSRG